MSIYTRRGDTGDTSLADGSRVRKDALRVEAYGALDEAGCAIGLARAAVSDPDVAALLRFVQQRLMNCAAITAAAAGQGDAPGSVTVADEDIAALERAIDNLGERTGAWTGFVLETGGDSATRLHLARSVTRRAERRLVALAAAGPVDLQVLSFVNRASDALYAAARFENLTAGFCEEPWDPSARPGF
jgi:cob(I)alamin adenosyltransferase